MTIGFIKEEKEKEEEKKNKRRSCHTGIGSLFGQASCTQDGQKTSGDPTRGIEASLNSLFCFNSVPSALKGNMNTASSNISRNKPAVEIAQSAINKMEKRGWNPEIIKRAVAGFQKSSNMPLSRRTRSPLRPGKKHQLQHPGLQMRPAA